MDPLGQKLLVFVLELSFLFGRRRRRRFAQKQNRTLMMFQSNNNKRLE